MVCRVGLLPVQPRFGFKMVADIGASDPRHGSLGVQILTNAGQPITAMQAKGQLAPQGFANTCEFLQAFARRLEEAWQANQAKIAAKGPQEEELTGLYFAVPGPTQNNVTPLMINLHQHNGQPLTDIHWKKVGAMVAANKIVPFNRALLMNNRIASNDMAPWATAAAALKNYETGDYKLIAPGGGLGVIDFVIENGQMTFKTSEGGQAPLATGRPQTLESDRTSVPALIKNFAQAAGFSPQVTEALLKLGDARVVSQHQVSVGAASQELAEVLNQSGLFTTSSSPSASGGAPSFCFVLKDKEAARQAAKQAAGLFIEGLAALTAQAARDQQTHVLLAGSLCNVLNDYLETQGKTLAGVVKARALSPEFSNEAHRASAEMNNLQVEVLDLTSNLPGMPAMLNAKVSPLNRFALPVPKA